MRILVAVDQNPYSSYVIEEVAKLAMSTWADVTILGIAPKTAVKQAGPGIEIANEPLLRAIRKYREDFLRFVEKHEAESPYSKEKCGYEIVRVRQGIWEELYVCRGKRKDLKVHLRTGNAPRQILAESLEEGSDLIVIGCGKGTECRWEKDPHVPLKVVTEAACSVLVVKEEKRPEKIVCCLDHDNVSQESLEMINQMVTLHNAELEIVGITKPEGLTEVVDRKMNEILKYYTARNIRAWVELVDISSFDSFTSQAAEKDLLAMWMGKKSFLSKLLPRHRITKLVQAAQSSVLILR